MIPPPVKAIVENSGSTSSRLSRRRLISIVATAAFASGIGAALGSAVRFQVIGVGEAAPLFKPQQDFPPLAEWPPEAPVEPSDPQDLDNMPWEGGDADIPQLVYKGPSLSSEPGASEELDTELESATAINNDNSPAVNSLAVPQGEEDNVSAEDVDELFPLDDRQLSDEGTDIDELAVESPPEDALKQEHPFSRDRQSRNYHPESPFPPDAAVSENSLDETWDLEPEDFVD